MKIKYKGGYKYQLVEDFKINTIAFPDKPIDTAFIKLDTDGLLHIRAGYAWDGPSGPTIDTKTFMRGSLAHDALYQLLRENKLNIVDGRKVADRILRDICRADGMSAIRAWWVYRGVRIGAQQSSVNGRRIRTAP